VEKAKRTLSTEHQTKLEIESFHQGGDFSETLTRARFEVRSVLLEQGPCCLTMMQPA
jgi:heat shock protein 5